MGDRGMTITKEQLLEIIDPEILDDFQRALSGCIENGHPIHLAHQYAYSKYGTARDAAFAKVDAILALLTAERVRPHPETPMGEPSDEDVEKTLARYWNSKTDGEPEHAYWPAHFRRDYGDDAVEEERGAMRCALQDLLRMPPSWKQRL
jgi:hypothetical protein